MESEISLFKERITATSQSDRLSVQIGLMSKMDNLGGGSERRTIGKQETMVQNSKEVELRKGSSGGLEDGPLRGEPHRRIPREEFFRTWQSRGNTPFNP